MPGYDYLKKFILPEKSYRLRHLEDKIHKTARLFNFEEIISPVIQKCSSYGECGKSEDSEENYYFCELKKDNFILRPEATLLILSAVKNMPDNDKPKRLYYMGSMFRKEKNGELKEFRQFGCEFIGSDKIFAEVELIRMGLKFFESLGIEDVGIELSSYGCRDFKGRMKNCDENIDDDKEINNACLPDKLCLKCRKKLSDLERLLSNLMIHWDENMSLERMFSYYNNTVFNFVCGKGDEKIVLGGGGRYDRIASEVMDRPYYAVGFSVDIDQLTEELERKNIFNSENRSYVTYFTAENEHVQLQLLQVTQDFVKENMPFFIESEYGLPENIVWESQIKKGLGVVYFEDNLAKEGKVRVFDTTKDEPEETVVSIGKLLEYFLHLRKSKTYGD
ncbi:MAG: hypothetical protein CSB55_03405 [Candidatus Cloacimonadota bacterium]|nr:MAG: hypothetical protein CSB55_03405 [Candidatus Cloacimonadota bacterium]